MSNDRLLRLLLCVFAVIPGSVLADVSVHLKVSCDDAPAPCADRGAYVALVAADDTLRKPTDEAVAIGGAANLVVPPGPYLLVTAASGYSMNFEPHRLRDLTSRSSVSIYRRQPCCTGRSSTTKAVPFRMPPLQGRALTLLGGSVSSALSECRYYGRTAPHGQTDRDIGRCKRPDYPKYRLPLTRPATPTR